MNFLHDSAFIRWSESINKISWFTSLRKKCNRHETNPSENIELLREIILNIGLLKSLRITKRNCFKYMILKIIKNKIYYFTYMILKIVKSNKEKFF